VEGNTLNIAPTAAAHAHTRLGLRLPAVIELTGVGRSAWLELVKRGLAPQARRVTGTRSVFWLRAEVEAWLERQPIAGGAK
jgi:predicted DNA-binding transcriptional regulator AlpA